MISAPGCEVVHHEQEGKPVFSAHLSRTHAAFERSTTWCVPPTVGALWEKENASCIKRSLMRCESDDDESSIGVLVADVV